MKSSHLGCFTSSGIIATLITALAIAGFAFIQGGGLYSPGALNAQAGEMLGGVTSHAETGGTCKACHVAPWSAERMADRCAACHTDIGAQMKNVASLHGIMTEKNPNLKCGHCHPDHRGADAPLTIAGGADFPHQELGYSLNGHQFKVGKEAFACRDCHVNGISSFDQVVCADCHRQMDAAFTDAHMQAWGSDCLACHDGVDTYGKNFDHNRFGFSLAGKHAQVDCYQCHATAHNIADLQATAQDCTSCHIQQDAHAGKFGTDCGACHSSEGWTPARFDHNLSAFKLEGAHAEVACDDCHKNKVFQGTPTDCYSCHARDDKHGGKFGTDCSSCHAPTRWDQATFDHNKSNFPLTGAHQNVNCEKCHVNAQFAGTSAACEACHADPAFHVGAFGTNCASCHNTNGWSPAQFNLSHPQPAGGEGGGGIFHGGASCRQCHPDTVRVYTCLACHTNNQGGGGD
jgi:hypothetical protein